MTTTDQKQRCEQDSYKTKKKKEDKWKKAEGKSSK